MTNSEHANEPVIGKSTKEITEGKKAENISWGSEDDR